MNVRRDIVRLRDDEKLSEREIARRLEIRPSVVHYWLAKHDRSHHVSEPPRRGRPRATTAELDEALYRSSLRDPFRPATDLRDELAPNVSADTVRNRLREKGLRCRVPARKPFLRETHVEKRFRFAAAHLNWSVRQWERVVFSDEKIFRASSRGPLRVYRPSDSDRFDGRYLAKSSNPAGNFTVNVWAAFGKGFRTMHRVESRTLDSEYYTRVILPSVEDHLARNDLVYMHDLASVHTSRLTAHWLESHNVEVMDDWPPKGPDMNPVENVWAELVRRTRNDATNRDQLYENVHATFLELDDAYFDALIESMPRRMAKVVEARGGWTKY